MQAAEWMEAAREYIAKVDRYYQARGVKTPEMFRLDAQNLDPRYLIAFGDYGSVGNAWFIIDTNTTLNRVAELAYTGSSRSQALSFYETCLKAEV